MGKKSLIKSTSKKKKTTSKKKDEDKKSQVAKKKGVTKDKPDQKVEAKKKAPAKKTASDKDLKLKDLIFKRFEREIPEKLFRVEPEQRKYTFPPIISTTDKKEAARLKALLFKKIDLTPSAEQPGKIEKPEKPQEDKKAKKPVEKKEVQKADYKEIMARKFYQPPSPEILAKSPHKSVMIQEDAFTAPPLIATSDQKEAERLKKLLFRKIDLTSPPEKPQEPEKVEKPAEKEILHEKPIKEKPTEEKPALPVEKKEVKQADYKEIMARKFFQSQPGAVLVKNLEAGKENFTAPPLISTDDPKEAARIRELLFRQFEIPPSPAQPITPVAEEKVPEEVAPEIVPESSESAEGAQEQTGVPDSEKPEAEKTDEEDKSPKNAVSHDEPPPTDTEVSDPMDKMIKLVAAGVLLIILMLVGYSFNNKGKYYIKPVEDGIEILQGRFAPMGEDVLARLIGVAPPENIKDVYKAEEVLPLVFNYYLDQADGLLNIKGIPDLKAIKGTLDKALSFALTKNERDLVKYRLTSMEKHISQYRANVVASRGTVKDVDIAIAILTDVLKLDMDEQQKGMIQNRIEYLRGYKEQLIAAEAQADENKAVEDEGSQEIPVEQEATDDNAAGAEEADKNKDGHQ